MQDSKAPADNSEFNRLWWHSRRGMLELDVLLIPFLEEVYQELDTEDQDRYEKLLTCEDTDMFEWFMQRSRPDDADLQGIVDIILARVQPD
ncbi:MAG: succinate dehydrogenase assembly factor 2 [Marinobacter sp.]|nr:succinate dehydrogenase assembly factor 2 [Marinobacter sp.]